MKNIIKTILLSVVVLGMSSCTEEKILDLKPVNNILSPDAFTTPTLIATYMNGVYNAAAIGQYNAAPNSPNGGRGYVWGAAFVQQGETRGEDVVNMATFYELTYTATYDPTTANNVYYWVDGYRLINRCNIMIEGTTDAVAKGVITKAVGDNYIGQAKFLRAITHLELLTYFARPYNFTAGATHPGIPYREVGVNTSAEITSESLKPRNTVAEVYDKVLADLNDAETLITTGSSTTFSSRLVGRASKWAAIAFKTRLYLQKRDWANVIVEGNKLSGAFALTADPYAPFQGSSAVATSNSESIFSIQHSATANPTVNGALPSMLRDRALVCISPILWRDTTWWLADDKRREDGKFIYTASGIKYTNKYTDVTNRTDAAPVIRYAEVVLNMAEAHARLSNLSTALNLLNSVRNRSLANPATQAYTAASFTTDATMVAAILKERRIEFLQEGRRWTDIHRLQGDPIASVAIDGIPAKYASGATPAAAAFVLGNSFVVTTPVAAIPGTDYKFLWPIPQIELNTNPGLGQNPNW
ncbi:RagB/SusD family nutrient uptake outer membrane protein [Flavobacterium sp. Fl-77]|uniref:RagB/SusD family nutrient uptake outer membrane protein n=1 Tax=Flavobacterium flavipigmentatum TaxID=2893884 RepID=A0AAJ2SB18_9FLAO|nr:MULTISPECIES: RagB/SusD family nutrient uptake outer membrane protein [unclassified Flavobacterium]MDX6183089.1 RagB/SusD family nutrient uptake outer membrane protein [Flavobacterium sp. Fl-33]MDX6186842.1 RagB/SusD family nutrient uptake outer membrane protein [Flavobacterium sp. Fl-77]UFH40495.1 RagB/SusD family nutrient uptake outer membrane protein [Flavobacterium sp. F-70]